MLNKQIFLIFTFASFLTLTCLASGEELSPAAPSANSPVAAQPSTASPVSPSTVSPVAAQPAVNPQTKTTASFHARVSATTTAVAAPGEMISFQAIADCGAGNVAISGSQSCTFTAIDGQSPIGSCPTHTGASPATCETETGALTRYWLGSCIAGPTPATLTVFATCMPASAVMPMPLSVPMPVAPLPIPMSPVSNTATAAAAPTPSPSSATTTTATETVAGAQSPVTGH